MPSASSSNSGFIVQPTSLDYAARLLEQIAGELGRLAGSFDDAFNAARAAAGEPDLERCLSLAALDFEEFTRAIATVSRENADKLQVASLSYANTDEYVAAGFDLAIVPDTTAAEQTSLTEGGPR
jgi:hypothetical protein